HGADRRQSHVAVPAHLFADAHGQLDCEDDTREGIAPRWQESDGSNAPDLTSADPDGRLGSETRRTGQHDVDHVLAVEPAEYVLQEEDEDGSADQCAEDEGAEEYAASLAWLRSHAIFASDDSPRPYRVQQLYTRARAAPGAGCGRC